MKPKAKIIYRKLERIYDELAPRHDLDTLPEGEIFRYSWKLLERISLYGLRLQREKIYPKRKTNKSIVCGFTKDLWLLCEKSGTKNLYYVYGWLDLVEAIIMDEANLNFPSLGFKLKKSKIKSKISEKLILLKWKIRDIISSFFDIFTGRYFSDRVLQYMEFCKILLPLNRVYQIKYLMNLVKEEDKVRERPHCILKKVKLKLPLSKFCYKCRSCPLYLDVKRTEVAREVLETKTHLSQITSM